jgi:hypothetical protein
LNLWPLTIGEPFKGSVFDNTVWLNGAFYYAMTITAFYMKDKQNWLDYSDHAIEIVPKLFPCLYKVRGARGKGKWAGGQWHKGRFRRACMETISSLHKIRNIFMHLVQANDLFVV